MPARHVLIIAAHPGLPDTESLGMSMARTYAQTAHMAGDHIRLLQLDDLDFDTMLRSGYQRPQDLEPCLRMAQDDIAWADELVLVFPIWWGGMPALLKGFLDRMLLPGFAFRYEPKGLGLTPLLKGKTARLIITMDTPRWIDRWLCGSPVIRQLRYPILRFYGIKLREVLFFSPFILSSLSQRQDWIERVRKLAHRH